MHALTASHTHTHTHTHSLCLTHYHTYTHNITCTLSHTHTAYHGTYTLSHTHTPYHGTYTHTMALMLSHTHIHTHTCSHTHTQSHISILPIHQQIREIKGDALYDVHYSITLKRVLKKMGLKTGRGRLMWPM